METSFGWLKQKWGIIGRKLRDIAPNCPEAKETLSKQSCSGKEPGWPLDSPAHDLLLLLPQPCSLATPLPLIQMWDFTRLASPWAWSAHMGLADQPSQLSLCCDPVFSSLYVPSPTSLPFTCLPLEIFRYWCPGLTPKDSDIPDLGTYFLKPPHCVLRHRQG